MKKKFRSFKEARKFAHSLKLKNVNTWVKFINSDDRPVDIPAKPEYTYKKEFQGMGDFLGTGRIANKNKKYRSFKDVRKFARSLNLKNGQEWNEYCKSGKRPDDIPSNPNQTYRNKGWKGMGDWLGTGNIANNNRKFWSFKEARKFAQSLNLKNRDEWMLYYKSDKRPNELPANPARQYKKEWINWGDWLKNQPRKFWSFKEARKFARSLDLKNENQWRVYCKSGKRPDYIPATPARTYKNEWDSMGDWLGTGYVAVRKRQYRTFKEARKFAQSLNLKNRNEWNAFCKSDKKPDDIPMNPYNAYKKEFQGMGDFLGTGNVATKEFWSFEKARAYVRKLGLKNNDEWVVFRKSDRRPDYIPASPQRTYKEFVSVGDWLGTGSISGQVIAANYLPFPEAKKQYKMLAKQYHLNNRAEWKRFTKTHQKLLDDLRIPKEPWRSYSRKRVWRKKK